MTESAAATVDPVAGPPGGGGAGPDRRLLRQGVAEQGLFREVVWAWIRMPSLAAWRWNSAWSTAGRILAAPASAPDVIQLAVPILAMERVLTPTWRKLDPGAGCIDRR